MRTRIALFMFSLLLLSSLAASAGQAQPDTWSLQILEADEQHVLLELTIPSFDSETVVQEGVAYQRLRVADWGYWGQAGQPQLPMHSVPLGIPWAGSPQIEVVEAESRTLKGYRLYPAPGFELRGTEDAPQLAEVFALDSGAYSADSSFPGPVAEAASMGLLRDQPMFQLRLYPFQYNPAQQELRVYRRLKVLVTFPTAPSLMAEAGRAEASPVFEGILARTLLNYEALPRPARAPIRPRRASLLGTSAGPEVKLKVEANGLYRVTYEDLLAVAPGLVGSNARNLELRNQGVTIPMYVEGETDGIFGPGDSLIFYGQAIDSEYARENVYWLGRSGAPGARMVQRDGAPGTGSPPGAFRANDHFEKDKEYWRALPNGEGKDHWFWRRLSVSDSMPVTADLAFDLHHIAVSVPMGELRLMLQGATYSEHRTQVYLNGTALLGAADQTWSGQAEKLYEIPVAQSLFVEGTNQLRVESSLPGGATSSELYVNWFEVTYQDTYVAEENQLVFAAPAVGTYTFQVTGFSTNAIGLFDVTDPEAPERITGYAVEAAGGGYRLRFGDFGTTHDRYLAERVDQLPTPTLELDHPSGWRSPDNGATYIIITHPNFYDAIQPLAAHRSSMGESVVTVKTEDVYDEFYHGIYDPQAIRSFLEYAYQNWTPRPVYVLLVGDASVDPKNNGGSSLPDLLPTYYVDTPLFGQTANDNWYTRVHGDDDYPDLIVGRIPARYNSHVNTVIDKVQAYEAAPPPGNWARRAVLVGDDNDPAFAGDMDTIAGMLPERITPVKMYAYDPSTSVPNEVSSGALLLAYSGHGSQYTWGTWPVDHRIFRQSQVQDLTNGNRLPFVSVANCLNGQFDDNNTSRAMAEEFLLRSNRGGIGSLAPASYGFPTTNSLMNEEFYHALLVEGDLTLGSAATTARIQAHVSRPEFPFSMFEAFTFFGDPALRLNVPAELTLEGQASPDPVLMGDQLTYTLDYTVSDADQARSLTLVDTLPQGVIFQSASLPPSNIYAQTLTWNLGDTPAGSYRVTVTALVKTTGLTHGQTLQNQAQLYDAHGGNETWQIETTVHDKPIAGLSASNDSPTELGSVTSLWSAITSGTNVVYSWDFDDGSPTKTGASVQHTYAALGTYQAQVTVTNGAGSQSRTTEVTITDVPPSASFISSSPDLIGQTSSFESTSGGTNLSYLWDFGDGSAPVSSTGPTIDHDYTAAGSYGVVLTITNSAGTDAVTRMVEILEEPYAPVADFTSSSPDKLGQATKFTNTSQDGGDWTENVSYAWDFDDGVSSSEKHPTHTYGSVGTFSVSLTITNSVGSDTYSDSVVITDMPVSGLAIESDNPTLLGLPTYLSATVDAGSNVSYHWALGDGSYRNGQSLSYTYSAMGSYTVVLTATNSMGSQVATAEVEIVEEQIEGLTISNSSPTSVGNPTTFSASTTAGTNIVYRWDFGDGHNSSLQNPTHTYGAIGEYTVVLTATNAWGNQMRSDTVSVLDVPISGLSVSTDSPTTLGRPTTLMASVGTGTNVAYEWELGDGHTTTGNPIIHTYAVRNTYLFTVTASNGIGSHVFTDTVEIVDERIEGLTISHSTPTYLGDATIFNASTTAGTNIVYQWDFGDGHRSTLRNPAHTYSAIGEYTVVLTATNEANSSVKLTTVSVLEPRDEFYIFLPLIVRKRAP